MKTFIIVVLLVALAAAAHYTLPRNPQRSFTHYLTDRLSAPDANPVAEQADRMAAKDYAAGCTFADRFFWIDVKKDGKTLYTGVFSHWFDRGQVEQTVDRDLKAASEKASQGLHQLGDTAQRGVDRLGDTAGKISDDAHRAARDHEELVTPAPAH